MIFEIFDASPDGDGYTGVEAETLAGVAVPACVTIATEGYELPLRIIPEGKDFAIETLTGLDEGGGGIWQTSSLVRQYDGRAAA